MALKKRKKPKSETEQLYMLEILIDSLDLYPEKIPGNRKYDMLTRIGFIDVGPVDIIVKEHSEVKSGRDGKAGQGNEASRFRDSVESVRSCNGKTCLFVQTPGNLIQSLKSTPLSVEVYRVRRGGVNRKTCNEHLPVCIAMAFPPESFCDQVTAAKHHADGLARPHTVMEAYTLCDERGDPCGSLTLYLRFSCFGSSIVDHLTLHDKFYVFQGFPLDCEFRGPKLGAGNRQLAATEASKNKSDGNTLLGEILTCAYSRLRDRRDVRADATFESLTRPRSPPRISVEQPEFLRLTSAEQLNDSRFRNMVYDAYPDEPTCSCAPSDRSIGHPMACRSGCTYSCCLTLRNPDILRSNRADDAPSLATVSNQADNHPTMDANDCDVGENVPRMRGGGAEDSAPNDNDNVVFWDDQYWYKENLANRTAGGSDGAATTPGEPATIIYQKAKEANPTQSQQRPNNPRSDAKPGSCVCPAKEQATWQTGPTCPKCSKKHCVGAECLIRAFKEAQAFVDSLGKVPGMLGLGLMDPSESPYFGTDLAKEYADLPSERRPVIARPQYPTCALSPSTQCIAPRTDKSIPSSTSVPYTVATIPGRGGVVREAIPMLPEPALYARPKRKEDKKVDEKPDKKEMDDVAPQDVVVGPCGEPKCKARRRTPNNRTITPEVPTAPVAEPSRVKPPNAKAFRFDRMRPRVGRPEGDRDVGRIPVKVSRRVMRYVYSIGDVYPGIHFGHKKCIDPRIRVPANMGWLWTTTMTAGKLKPRIGWKPGAISRYLYELLKEAKGASTPGAEGANGRSKSVSSRTGLRRKVFKPLVSQVKKENDDAEPPPTLHIHRKDGTYYVTMYPIKPETTDVAQLEEPMKPLQFKIVKNKDDASDDGTSSTASDMEIEFSPPAAVSRYRKKPDVIHVDTQVKQHEILEAFKIDAPKKRERKVRPKKGR